jgi:hypothetical protein
VIRGSGKSAKDEREGLGTGCDGKARQSEAGNDGFACRRQPLGIVGREIDHQADYGDRLVLEPPDANATHFDHPRQRRRRACQQAAVTRFEVHAVIRHQTGEPQQPGLRRLDQPQRQARLAGSGGPADQDGPGADKHG